MSTNPILQSADADSSSSSTTGQKALSGEWEYIPGRRLNIEHNMNMSFQGGSCSIVDGDGNLVVELGKEDGLVSEQKVESGYRCHVMHAWVKFVKLEA